MNWPSDFANKVICGDCLELMNQMPDESVDMVMTSPPYWGLRDYGIEQVFGGNGDCEHEWTEEKMTLQHENRNLITGTQEQAHKKRGTTFIKKYDDKKAGFCQKCGAWKGQLGLEPTPEMYIEHLTIIFNEIKRVLKKEGTLWLNIGDTYWGGKGKSGYPLPHDEDRRYKEGKTLQHGYQVPGYMEMRPPDGKHDFIQPKCLTMIPERLAWSLIQNGWILRNKIIWYKPNSMPSSVKDRFSNRWEVLFLFVKSSNPVYWTNKKTGQLVAKKPLGIKGQEGMDWEWREVQEWKQEEEKGYEMGSVDSHRVAMRGGLLGGGKHKKQKGKLKKVSLWTAHDYYFDLDAVREPHKYDGRKDTLYKGGPKDMQIGKHERWPDPAGKNLGDVIKVERKWDEVPGQVTQSIARDHGGWFRKDGSPIVDFEKGKNPGDVFEVGAETRTMGAVIGSGGAVKVPGGKGWTGHPKGGGATCQKDPRWCPPEGKNPGDFLEINTQPFPEAHFAVFPETLCERPIKAGCPEQVCRKCGKARVRIIKLGEIVQTFGSDKGKTAKSDHYGDDTGNRKRIFAKKMIARQHETIGWTSCNCNADFEGGIVFDPFAGAGTVGVVTKKLGRQFILIDIKKEYCEMAERRIAQVGYQMELRI